MTTWKIKIPEQELEWESSDEPDIKLVIDGMPDHRYLLDYDATQESHMPHCPRCEVALDWVEWINIVKRDECNSLRWDEVEMAWTANQMEGTKMGDWSETVETYVQCTNCFERIEVGGDFTYWRIEPKES